MIVKTVFEYSYNPHDLFEAATILALDGGTLAVEVGLATLTLPEQRSVVDRHKRDTVNALVRAVFEARQLLAHRSFELSEPRIAQYHADGSRSIPMFVEAGAFSVVGFPVEFTVTDAAGNVVRDSRAERIDREAKILQEVASKVGSSATLRRMLLSYSSAVADPGNELVHLYEVRDAAAKHFGGDHAAQSALALKPGSWSSLGRLANAEPLREGRHRGKQIHGMREAKEDELEAARDAAFDIVLAFARTL